jgi:hypothetical protein
MGVTQAVVQKILDRSAIGAEKYGKTMDRKDLSGIEWLSHLQEELMDASQYIEAILQRHERLQNSEEIDPRHDTRYR